MTTIPNSIGQDQKPKKKRLEPKQQVDTLKVEVPVDSIYLEQEQLKMRLDTLLEKAKKR